MLQPFFIMLAAMALYALFPVAFAEAQRLEVALPEFVLGIHLSGFALILGVNLVLAVRGHWTVREATLLVRHRGMSRQVVLGMAFNMATEVFLFLAILGARKVQGSVIYELWPVVFLVLAWIYRDPDKGGINVFHDAITTLALFVIGSVGLVFVAASSLDERTVTGGADFLESSILFGALAAIAMGTSTFFTTGAIRQLKTALNAEDADQDFVQKLKPVAFSLFWFRLISVIFAGLLFFVFDRGSPLDISLGQVLVPSVVYGGMVVGLGGLVFHLANVLSRHANINLLWYLVPVVATVFFVVFGYAEALDDRFYQGLLLIVAANFGLNLNIDMTKSFRALLITLCLSSLALNTLPRIPSPYYFESLSVITSVFAIIIAFVLNRAYTRRSLINDAIARIHFFGKALDDTAVVGFPRAVITGTLEPKKAHAVVQRFSDVRPDLARDLIQVLRQRDVWISFGELFSVWLLGLGSVAVAVLARPDSADNPTTFLPVILSTVVVFLCANLTEVSRPVLDAPSASRGFERLGISPEPDDRSMKFDVFVGICFVMVLLALHVATTWT